MTRTESSTRAGVSASGREGPAEVALLDRDGVIVDVNRHWHAYCLEHGGDPDRCGVGVSYLEVCDHAAGDPVAAGVAAAIRAAIGGEQPDVPSHRVSCEGAGGTEWFDVRVAPRLGRSGSCLGATVEVVPVPADAAPPADTEGETARMRTPDMLAVLDVVSDGVVVLDAQTLRRIYVNRANLDRMGYSRSELTRIPLGGPATPEDGARLRAAIDDVMSGRADEASIDVGVRHRAGTVVPVEVRVTYRPPPESGGGGFVVLVSRDQRERLAATQRLRRSEESFRAAFEQPPIGMAVCRLLPDGRRVIARANAALGQILGMPPSELTGHDLSEFTTEADEELDRGAARAMIAGSRQRWSRRKRYVRPDGSQVWVDVSASLVDFPAVDGVTTLAHIVDVTRTRELELARVRRAALAALAADVSALVIGGATSQDLHRVVVRSVPEVFEAVGCALLLLAPGRRHPVVSAVSGPGTDPPRLSRRALAALASARDNREFAGDTPFGGPAVVVRFPHDGEDGLLLVWRAPGDEHFTPSDTELLTELAERISVAVQLGLARQAQQVLARLEERQHIARDLHDTVIQDLIAVGMRLDAEVDGEPDAGRRQRSRELVTEMDGVVQQLREAVFTLGGRRSGEGLGPSLHRAIHESARILGFTPAVRIVGPVQEVPPAVGGEVLAVLREALSNIARHARAASATVRLTVRKGLLTLTIDDDGVGIGSTARSGAGAGNGLSNIAERARDLGGDSEVTRRASGGTRLRWCVPLHVAGAPPAQRATRRPEG